MDLAFALINIKASRDKAVSEHAVQSTRISSHLELVDELIEQYQGKLQLMKASSKTSSIVAPSFIEGSSQTVWLTIKTPKSQCESQSIDELMGDESVSETVGREGLEDQGEIKAAEVDESQNRVSSVRSMCVGRLMSPLKFNYFLVFFRMIS